MKTVDEESPIRAVFCLKKEIDMRRIEEVEDCFILDFDPTHTFQLSLTHLPDDSDLSFLGEKGQVACRDYPHPRHLCVKFPFHETPQETHCQMCFCFVCDKAAPCKSWSIGTLKHCDAYEDEGRLWSTLRDLKKNPKSN